MWGLGRDVWCWWCVLAFVAHVLHASRGGSQGGWLYEGGDGAGGIGDIIVDRSKLGGGALAASCGGAAHDFYHIVQHTITMHYFLVFIIVVIVQSTPPPLPPVATKIPAMTARHWTITTPKSTNGSNLTYFRTRINYR